MKQLLRTILSPILNFLESGSEPYVYKPSHRKILIFMGSLFTGLAGVVLWLAQGQDPGYFLPVVIFGIGGLLSLGVGVFGNDRAVAKIWGSR